MRSDRVLDTFLEFYLRRGHRRVRGSSLIPPPGDPVLFTTSGMHPLTPYLTGREHPDGRRLVNVQRCLRTTDLDEVGDPVHLTVFQMLGTWSLGDYPHSESLRFGYELLCDGYGIDPRTLHVTVFGGSGDVGPDEPSGELWGSLGLPVEFTTHGENWWSNGPTGPCGTDSEVFFWSGDGPPTGTPTTDDRWVEIWNHVHMTYERRPDGLLVPLEVSNVDTGMGFERLLSVLQGTSSVYETDVFEPWTREVGRLWRLSTRDRHVVCDHLRSSVVVLGDGVRPGNTSRGYVLRRLVRRLLTTLWRGDGSRTLLDLPDEPFERTLTLFEQPAGVRGVRRVLDEEEHRFRTLVERGRTVVSRQLSKGPLTDEVLRYLHDTHGLPADLVLELAR